MAPNFFLSRSVKSRLICVIFTCSALIAARAETATEYEIKAAVLYNFLSFAEWPAEVANTLTLCVYGEDPFGKYLDDLQGKSVGERRLSVRRVDELPRLEDCNVAFIARSVGGEQLRIVEKLNGKPVLTVADTPGSVQRGIGLNMSTYQNKVTFEANLAAVRDNGLNLSSRLLLLATEVIQ